MPALTFADLATFIEEIEAGRSPELTPEMAGDLLNLSRRYGTPLSLAAMDAISTAFSGLVTGGWTVRVEAYGSGYRTVFLKPGKELPPNDGEHD